MLAAVTQSIKAFTLHVQGWMFKSLRQTCMQVVNTGIGTAPQPNSPQRV